MHKFRKSGAPNSSKAHKRSSNQYFWVENGGDSDIKLSLYELMKKHPYIFYTIFKMFIEQKNQTVKKREHIITYSFPFYSANRAPSWAIYFEYVDLDSNLHLLSATNLTEEAMIELDLLYQDNQLPLGYAALYRWSILQENLTAKELSEDIDLIILQMLNDFKMIQQENKEVNPNEITTIFPIQRDMTPQLNQIVQSVFGQYFQNIKMITNISGEKFVADYVTLGKPL